MENTWRDLVSQSSGGRACILPNDTLRSRQLLLSPRIKAAVPCPPPPSSRCRLEWRSETETRGRGAETEARSLGADSHFLPGELKWKAAAGYSRGWEVRRKQAAWRGLHGLGSCRSGPSHSCTAQAGGSASLPPLPLPAELTCPAPTLAADVGAEFHKLQQLWPVPPLLTSFLPQKRAAEGGRGGGGERKGCNNNPKPFHLSSLHIYQQAQFSVALSLSLAHNQMIAQGFAERKHEAAEPASPLPVWGGGGSGGHHIIRRKRCTCFQQWRGVERAHKESQVVARKIIIWWGWN